MYYYINIIDILLKPYILKKDYNNYKNIKIKKINNNIINNNNLDNNKLLKLKYSKEILLFIKILENNFDKKDLNNLYNNLNSLKIFIHNNKFDYIGSYNQYKNIMYLYKSDAKHIIYHELFHLTSNKYNDKDISFCGFHQRNFHNNTDIGFGLCEGYTELLTIRYFSNYNIYKAYEIEVDLASNIENIIGKDIMEKLYLNANLNGLIKELEIYEERNNIIKFISMIDFISKYKNLKNNKLLENAYLYVNNFINKCNFKKNSY